MRKRYQRGSVSKSTDGRYWVGKYREDGRHRSKLLGKVREMTKSEAKERLEAILRPVNAATEGVGPTVLAFLEATYFPFFARKWKPSTLATNRDQVGREIGGALGDRALAGLTRDDLQGFLDSKAGLAYSTVSHLRWDLKQIFDVAMSDGLVDRNPAAALFVPRGCSKPKRRIMTIDDIRLAVTVLPLRERLVFKLAVLAGMRPGEIFGLRRCRAFNHVVDIRERIYRGQLDTPKTDRSVRLVPLSGTVREDLASWLGSSPGPRSDSSWLFPSERLATPVSKDNLMARYMRPTLERVGLGWVNFLVMRRTHASLMRDRGVDPKIVADMMGHGIGVNLNVYTETSMTSRLAAAESLGSLVN